MKLDDYNKLFDNCSKNKMAIEKYQPVKDQIIRICNHYILNKEFIKHYGRISNYKGKQYNRGKIDFVRDLLKVFNRIIKEKKYDNLDEYIDLLIGNDEVRYYNLPDWLTVLVFKNDYIVENEYFDNYYHRIDKMCEMYSKKDAKIYGHIPIAEMFRLYRKYDILAREIRRLDVLHYGDWQFVYFHLAPYIIAEYYLNDYDVNTLEPLLSYVLNNQKLLIDYINMNYDEFYASDRETKITLAKALINNVTSQKIIIK